MLKVLSSILCDLDPKVKALGQKAGICDGVPSTSALVCALCSSAGKGLTSWLSFVVSTVSLSLSHWYPGSG